MSSDTKALDKPHEVHGSGSGSGSDDINDAAPRLQVHGVGQEEQNTKSKTVSGAQDVAAKTAVPDVHAQQIGGPPEGTPDETPTTPSQPQPESQSEPYSAFEPIQKTAIICLICVCAFISSMSSFIYFPAI